MILTGPAIELGIAEGTIKITPFDPKAVGPNSVDLRLADEIAWYMPPALPWDGKSRRVDSEPLDMLKPCQVDRGTIGEGGLVLRPGHVYLASTIERVGSDHFVPIVEGRSSIGRLGIRIHQTAGFCDTGFHGNITLEIDVVQPVRVYAGVAVCQVYFLRPEGPIRLYEGRYRGEHATGAVASRLHEVEQ